MLQTQSYSTEEIEKGIVLVYNAPGSAIKAAEEYFYYFDVVTVLPKNPAPTITFDPPTASYAILADKTFRPKIAISIKSVHRSQCQVLCRLTIKDRYANTLYTDYILVIAVPKSSVSFNCTLLPSTPVSNIGPDGGSVLVVNDTTSANLSYISAGMVVTGPGLPTDRQVFIKNFIFDSNNRLELSELIELTNNAPRTGIFNFTLETKCVDPTIIETRTTLPQYIILNKENNWTYIYNDKIIAKFTRENLNDDSIVIFLPTKNPSLLPDNQEPSNISNAPLVKISGRVINDSVCISSLTFD